MASLHRSVSLVNSPLFTHIHISPLFLTCLTYHTQRACGVAPASFLPDVPDMNAAVASSNMGVIMPVYGSAYSGMPWGGVQRSVPVMGATPGVGSSAWAWTGLRRRR